jgi:mono/diheme cytochrome c family protein
MPRSITVLGSLAVAGAVLSIGSFVSAAEDPSVTAGRKVAERNCAVCHAIADGESPLQDAPPFARLKYRYGAGGLTELLEKGMIKDWPRPLEEGSRLLHPRMPAFQLGEDEVVALAEYLRTFEKDAVTNTPSGGRK